MQDCLQKRKIDTYADFVADRVQIVVATIAFGMGIDKSNIRFVVHMTMPKTLENFYQEIGRAGRDGLEAETLLLFSAQDIVQQKMFIEDLPETPYKQHAFNKLDSMVRFANSENCRHQSIAAYFDDRIEACGRKCDNCTAPAESKNRHHYRSTYVTLNHSSNRTEFWFTLCHRCAQRK